MKFIVLFFVFIPTIGYSQPSVGKNVNNLLPDKEELPFNPLNMNSVDQMEIFRREVLNKGTLKTTESDKKLCDSIYWYTFRSETDSSLVSKIEYNYDPYGNITMYENYTWDTLNTRWNGTFKYENSRDVNGNVTLYTAFAWDPLTRQWLQTNKTEIVYNEDNKETLWTYYHWDIGTGQWRIDSKIDFVYDPQGMSLTTTTSNWDTTAGKWEIYFKTIVDYDADGYVILR